MKTFVISDIHGCALALDKLLNKIAPDHGEDRLVLLGDLFDRGPDSWEVLETVKMLKRSFGERFVLLRGNHEDYLLQPKLTFSQRFMWERVGRGATVRSFKAHGEKMEASAPWLQKNCKMYYVDELFQCVHAGVKVEPVHLNDAQTLMHDHDVVLENRYKGRLTVTGHIALRAPTWFAGDKKTAVKLPMGETHHLPDRGVICIDTGCGKGGRLTAMVIEGDRYTLESVAEK